MANKAVVRKIVRIDPQRCDGCGLCVPACAEGAIRIVDGKAVLAAENLCDGLGNCLGECPRGAITIEERPAEAFDESAVRRHLSQGAAKPSGAPSAPATSMPAWHGGAAADGGCPGAMARPIRRPAARPAAEGDGGAGGAAGAQSQLSQWPVQLALVPVSGEFWGDSDVLIAADCVPFALPDFHGKLLAGRKLAVACPKLDDMTPHVEKLARIFSGSSIRSVTVVRMEVPCCGGIVRAVQAAMERAGRSDIPFREVTVGIEGHIL